MITNPFRRLVVVLGHLLWWSIVLLLAQTHAVHAMCC